jgi:hypothetical protein
LPQHEKDTTKKWKERHETILKGQREKEEIRMQNDARKIYPPLPLSYASHHQRLFLSPEPAVSSDYVHVTGTQGASSYQYIHLKSHQSTAPEDAAIKWRLVDSAVSLPARKNTAVAPSRARKKLLLSPPVELPLLERPRAEQDLPDVAFSSSVSLDTKVYQHIRATSDARVSVTAEKVTLNAMAI